MPRVCIQDLFTAQAERTPEATAVIFESQHVSYHELNARANQIAHRLRQLGVGANVMVGVYMRRSVELPAAILGILKAGGAFVPLDPDYPKDRLAFMLDDTRLPVLVTQPGLLTDLPPHGALVLGLDPDGNTVAGERRDNPPCDADADCLAYVIYTSGSTGRPKGILVPHRGLTNYLLWCTEAYDVAAGNGAPLASSISFDLTITSLFPPLLAGRPVHVLPEGSGIDALRDALRQGADYSLVKITPAHLELLGQMLEPHKAAGGARAFIVGGENLTSRQIAFWQTFAPETILVNEYGPTETVVGCCTYRVPLGKHPPGSVPIGKPIANTRLYVVDALLRLVSPGTPGELCIGGAGLAWGYHNRPDLTAEQFIPDPFSGAPGARLYRTGDLVRELADGNLEFLGRIDQLVKIHGYRIELGEIEAVLSRHPSVRQAAVLAREDALGEKRLVAYVVPQSAPALTIAAVRRYLAERLPVYMVPAAVVILDALPLTRNGKVDYQALPATVRTQLELTGCFVAPRNGLEEQMARLWEEILDVRPVGVQDNFFELGGDSVTAVRLCTKIRTVFGRDLSPSSLLETPTVEQLAGRLSSTTEAAAASPLVLIQPRGRRRPFFCVHGIGGEVVGFAELARLLGPEQPFYGIQSHPSSTEGEPAAPLEVIAARYLAEVQAVQPEGPYYLGGFSFGATVAFEMAQQLQAAGERVALLAILDKRSFPGAPTIRLTPGLLAEFVRNIPPWLRYDFLCSRRTALASRFWLKTKNVLKKLAGLFRRPAAESPRPGIDTLYHLSSLSKPFARLLEAYYQAMMDYVPRPYSGDVTVFRARAQGLFHFVPMDLGWGELAPGRVETHVVPGSHDNMLHAPYVETLAEQLRAALEAAHQRHEPDEPHRAKSAPFLPREEAADDGRAGLVYKVVVNDECQYSVWPADRDNPPGWDEVGYRGTKAECLAHLRAVWTNGCRPRSSQEDGLTGRLVCAR